MKIPNPNGQVNGRFKGRAAGKAPEPASNKAKPKKPRRMVDPDRSARNLLRDQNQPRRAADVELEDTHDECPPTPDDEFVGSMYRLDAEHKQSGIFAPEWVMRVTRTRAELLVLAQIVYWFGVDRKGKLRAKVKRNRYLWIYKTRASLGRECCLTKDQVRGAVRSLQKQAILIVEDDADAGHRVFYRLNPKQIQSALEAATEIPTEVEEDDDE